MLKQLLDILKELINRTPTWHGIVIIIFVIIIVLIIQNLDKLYKACQKIFNAIAQFKEVSELNRSIELQKIVIRDKTRLLREESEEIEKTIQSLEGNVNRLNQCSNNPSEGQVAVVAKIETNIDSLKIHLQELRKISEENNDIEDMATRNIDVPELAKWMDKEASQKGKRKNTIN